MSVNRLADDLEHMRRTQRAVVMSLVIVGEAATKAMAAAPDSRK
jgi:uncharacterized protein with HEPN domain